MCLLHYVVALDGADCILMLESGGYLTARLAADDIKLMSSYFPKYIKLVCCRGSRADGDHLWQGIAWASVTLLCRSDAFSLDSMYLPADVVYPLSMCCLPFTR